MSSPVAIGVDVGGTFTKLVAVTADGIVRSRARVETDGGSAERLLAVGADKAASVADEVLGRARNAIGLLPR